MAIDPVTLAFARQAALVLIQVTLEMKRVYDASADGLTADEVQEIVSDTVTAAQARVARASASWQAARAQPAVQPAQP